MRNNEPQEVFFTQGSEKSFYIYFYKPIPRIIVKSKRLPILCYLLPVKMNVLHQSGGNDPQLGKPCSKGYLSSRFVCKIQVLNVQGVQNEIVLEIEKMYRHQKCELVTSIRSKIHIELATVI